MEWTKRMAIEAKINSPLFWRQSLKNQLAEIKDFLCMANDVKTTDPVAVAKVVNELHSHACALNNRISTSKMPRINSTELKMIRAVSKRLKMILETYDD